jgi:hypothetical protein
MVKGQFRTTTMALKTLIMAKVMAAINLTSLQLMIQPVDIQSIPRRVRFCL